MLSERNRELRIFCLAFDVAELRDIVADALFALPEQRLGLAILALNDFAPPFQQLATTLNLPHQHSDDDGQHEDDHNENQLNVVIGLHSSHPFLNDKSSNGRRNTYRRDVTDL